MATIADEAENERIYAHVGQGYDSVWIGLYQTETSDDAPWQWVNGQNTTFFNWEEGEPNNNNGLGGSEDCGHMNNDNGYWNDLDCDNTRGYVCQTYKIMPTP